MGQTVEKLNLSCEVKLFLSALNAKNILHSPCPSCSPLLEAHVCMVTFDRASLLIRAPEKIFPQIMGWGGGGEGTAVRPSLRPISFYGLRQYVHDLFPAAILSLCRLLTLRNRVSTCPCACILGVSS